jgi:CubicO group peptidase (beta-lactamase class C family)
MENTMVKAADIGPSIEGECDPAFDPVKEAFVENFRTRGDVGAAVSVVVEGRTVVDLWGGDAAPGRPWERDTIVSVVVD